MSLFGLRELIDGVRAVRADTIRIATDVPADRYEFRPTPESRSVAETLVHIAWLWNFDWQVHGGARLPTLEGFDFGSLVAGFRAEEAKPRSKEEIVELLRIEGERYLTWLRELPAEILPERVGMPGGGSLSRFELLLSTKEHEMHHRAQLTVLERLVGVVPHNIPMAAAPEPDSVFASGGAARRLA